MIKLSIIIPAYNQQNYIGECINSLVNQDLEEVEIIVVNDGSTDNTREIIEGLKQSYSNIKCINKVNGGVNSARNAGLKYAIGEYVTFVDGDDWIEKNSLKVLYNKVKEHNLDMLCFGFYFAKDNILEKSSDVYKTNTEEKMSNVEYIKKVLLIEAIPTICGKIIKRDVIMKNYIEFNEKLHFGEDLAMNIECAMHSDLIGIEEESYYYYRQHNSSVSSSLSEKVLTIVDSLNYIKKLLEEKGLYETLKREYEYLFYRNVYYYLVLNNNNTNDIHKTLYKKWKDSGINITNNMYYKEFKKTYNRSIKIRELCYDSSYYLGKTLVKAIGLIKSRQ